MKLLEWWSSAGGKRGDSKSALGLECHGWAGRAGLVHFAAVVARISVIGRCSQVTRLMAVMRIAQLPMSGFVLPCLIRTQMRKPLRCFAPG